MTHKTDDVITPTQWLSEQKIAQINQLLVQATDVLMKIYDAYVAGEQDIDIQKKADQSPVTQADMALHALICAGLETITPDIFCLSEESVDDIEKRQHLSTLWLLDPVDGTRAFIGKTGEFTINLTLIHQQQVCASWLVVPTQQSLYWVVPSINNQITELNMQTGATKQMSVNHMPLAQVASKTGKLRVGLSRNAQISDYQPMLDALAAKYDCQVSLVQAFSAYKFVQMLRNEIDVYVRAYPTCEWDTASGQGFMESLGGQLMNFRGNVFLYNARNTLKNGGFVCFKNSADKTALLATCQHLIEET